MSRLTEQSDSLLESSRRACRVGLWVLGLATDDFTAHLRTNKSS